MKDNNVILGIELGSTRIKAVAIDERFKPTSSGNYTWASAYENGVWTYPLDEVWTGLKTALSRVDKRENVRAMGISGMMHGYLAFDADWNLLTPFRTWQNTITGPAAAELTALFGPAVVHRPPVSGGAQRGGTRPPRRPHHHPGRVRPLYAHRRERRGRGRGVRDVPH